MDFLNQLLPLACEWAEQQQEHILETGIALTESQIDDARLVGVSCPEKVRLLKVEQIPWPENPMLLSIGQQAGFFTDRIEGLALGYGIFVKSNRWQDRRLVVHELAHVNQYERLGSISQFLQQYVTECLSDGYDGGPLENEARETTVRICGDQGYRNSKGTGQ